MNTVNEKLGTAQREKYWDERDINEQTNALRYQIIALTQQLDAACRMLEKLMIHSHALDGALVAPLDVQERYQQSQMPTSIRLSHDAEI